MLTIPSQMFIRPPCRCRSHKLHEVFLYSWEHPSATRSMVAEALRRSIWSVDAAFRQLQRLDLTVMCPECFRPRLFEGVCQSCGFEPEAPVIQPDILTDSQSPTNNLHAGNQLGTEVDYDKLGFVSRGYIVKRRMERGIEDALTLGVKSEVEDALKHVYPSESITDEAGRLAIKEVLEFRARYPDLATSKNLRAQLARNVVRRLVLLHPHLMPLALWKRKAGT